MFVTGQGKRETAAARNDRSGHVASVTASFLRQSKACRSLATGRFARGEKAEDVVRSFDALGEKRTCQEESSGGDHVSTLFGCRPDGEKESARYGCPHPFAPPISGVIGWLAVATRLATERQFISPYLRTKYRLTNERAAASSAFKSSHPSRHVGRKRLHI